MWFQETISSEYFFNILVMVEAVTPAAVTPAAVIQLCTASIAAGADSMDTIRKMPLLALAITAGAILLIFFPWLAVY
jgi:hypothetical protein